MLPEQSLLIASVDVVMKQAIIEEGNKEREYGR